MKKPLITITIGLMLSLLLASTTMAATASAQKQWRLHGSLQAVETNQVTFPTLNVTGSGSGHATHLGRFSITFQATVYLPTLSATVAAHLVAANGDTLFAEGTGQGDLTVAPGMNQIVEQYTITGGTGRFAGASGSFTVERLLNLTTGISSGTFTGDILVP
jgi:hypothetical protein